MKVLVVNNRHRQFGGEDAVVAEEASLLRDHRHEVIVYGRSNEQVTEMGPVGLLRDTLWSARTYGEVDRLLAAPRPEGVHVHNAFPPVWP